MMPRTSHPLQRLEERYGIEGTAQDLVAMRKQIKSGQSVLKATLKDGQEQHMIKHGDVVVIAIWDPAVGRILTFLAPDSNRIQHRERHVS